METKSLPLVTKTKNITTEKDMARVLSKFNLSTAKGSQRT